MFFILSKLLSFLLSPIVWIIVILIVSLLVKKSRKRVKLILTALILLIVFSNSFIVDEFYRITETEMVKDDQIKTCDVGIVLGGGILTIDHKLDRLIFHQNTDRLFQALRLYKVGKIKKIMLSGGSGSLDMPDMKEASLMRKYLIGIGIPDSIILVDSLSRNTYENAINVARICKAMIPNGKFLLITSALHMPRAERCFRKQGLSIDVYPVSKQTGIRRWDFNQLLMPRTENITKWELLLHEWVGMIMYKINGYI